MIIEIVDFVENIEEGVGVLKYCGRENAVDNLFTTNPKKNGVSAGFFKSSEICLQNAAEPIRTAL